MENTTDLETDRYGFYKLSPPEYFHHNHEKMVAYLKSYNSTYPNITDLKSVGQSVQGRELYVFVIGKDPLKHVAGKFT